MIKRGCKFVVCCNSIVRVALECDRMRRPLFFGLMGLQGASGKFNLSLMGLGKQGFDLGQMQKNTGGEEERRRCSFHFVS